MATRVRICFFKPTGFEDTHYVETDDRGAAVVAVMAKYGQDHLEFVNYVECGLCEMPKHQEQRW